jgi:hypothetical protein
MRQKQLAKEQMKKEKVRRRWLHAIFHEWHEVAAWSNVIRRRRSDDMITAVSEGPKGSIALDDGPRLQRASVSSATGRKLIRSNAMAEPAEGLVEKILMVGQAVVKQKNARIAPIEKDVMIESKDKDPDEPSSGSLRRVPLRRSKATVRSPRPETPSQEDFSNFPLSPFVSRRQHAEFDEYQEAPVLSPLLVKRVMLKYRVREKYHELFRDGFLSNADPLSLGLGHAEIGQHGFVQFCLSAPEDFFQTGSRERFSCEVWQRYVDPPDALVPFETFVEMLMAPYGTAEHHRGAHGSADGQRPRIFANGRPPAQERKLVLSQRENRFQKQLLQHWKKP